MNTHNPIPLRPDPGALFSSQRRSFVRAATALALASRDRQRPEAILGRAWPDDSAAPRILKAATSPTTSADLPFMTTTVLLPLLAPASASAQLLGLATALDLRGVVSISLPFIGATGRPAVVPFVAEGKPMPIVDLTTSATVLGPTKKLLIGSALTREVQNGSAGTATAIIGSALSISTEQSMDAALFSSNAATTAAPAGILNGIVAIPSSAKTGAEGIAADLALLAQAIAANGINSDGMIVVTTPALATKLRCLISPKFDNTVLSSSSLASGEVIAVASGGLVTGYDGSISIEVTEEPVLHIEDAIPADIGTPGTPNVVAAPSKSMWQTDSLALKIRGWTAWSVHPGSVAWITGAAW